VDADPSRPLNTPQPASGTERKDFLRSVLALVSGTALGHGITAASMPVLSRLYGPADFGLLAVFASCLGILSVIACLRFELAIPLPDSAQESGDLLRLSLVCCAALSLVIGLPVWLWPAPIADLLGQVALAPYLGLLPLGVLLAGSYSAFQFWHVREKGFSWLAQTRVGQSAGSAATQIGMGIAGTGPIGLLLGHVMNTGVACVALGGALRRAEPWPTVSRLRQLARTYRRFPLWSTPEALANSAALQLPVILIAAAVAPAEAGYLTMALFVIQAPMSLIGTAIGQVYVSQAPAALREQRLGPFTAEVFSGLWRAGAGPLLALGILSPMLFEPVFGEGWSRAGWLVTWMTPWFVAQFLAVPLSMALHTCGRQREALVLQVSGLVLRVGVVLAAAQWLPAWITEAYAVSGAIFYLAYLVLLLKITGTQWAAIRQGLLGGCGALAAWGGAAALLVMVAQGLKGLP
jgi:O-antigen/teichoic acid export membrane protein